MFLVSDFQDAGYEKALKIAKRKHDIIPIAIADQRELEVPNIGMVRLKDNETGEVVTLDTSSRKHRELYRQAAERQREQRDEMFRRIKARSNPVNDWAGLRRADPRILSSSREKVMIHFNQKIRSIQTLLCLSLMACASATASAATAIEDGDVHATATASKSTVGVADPFSVTIEAAAPEGITVRLPEVGDQVGDFEITGHRDTLDVPDAGGRKYQRQLTLETLKTGHLNVPEFEVFFKDSGDSKRRNGVCDYSGHPDRSSILDHGC